MRAPVKRITLYVYFKSKEPIGKIELAEDDRLLDWLKSSMTLMPCGEDVALRISDKSELRQLRHHFPLVGKSSRHLRFRGIIRRKATKKEAIHIERFTEHYTPILFESPKMSLFNIFRTKWISALFKRTLNS